MQNSFLFGDLRGRRAVVTGASSGIGRSIAAEFAQAGADVVVHYRTSRSGADATAQLIREAGRQAWLLPADLTSIDPAELVETAWTLAGGVDIWVNNAGVDVLTGPAAKLSFSEKLDQLWSVDVRAALLLSKLAGERMRTSRGVLLHIGWDQAERGMEGDSGELFAATKNAVMGFTRSLACSLAPEVRVNCIAPGWIQTAWGETASSAWQERVLRETPLRRWGRPEDIAKLARFLVSEDAAYLTGQVIYANGGAER